MRSPNFRNFERHQRNVRRVCLHHVRILWYQKWLMVADLLLPGCLAYTCDRWFSERVKCSDSNESLFRRKIIGWVTLRRQSDDVWNKWSFENRSTSIFLYLFFKIEGAPFSFLFTYRRTWVHFWVKIRNFYLFIYLSCYYLIFPYYDFMPKFLSVVVVFFFCCDFFLLIIECAWRSWFSFYESAQKLGDDSGQMSWRVILWE